MKLNSTEYFEINSTTTTTTSTLHCLHCPYYLIISSPTWLGRHFTYTKFHEEYMKSVNIFFCCRFISACVFIEIWCIGGFHPWLWCDPSSIVQYRELWQSLPGDDASNGRVYATVQLGHTKLQSSKNQVVHSLTHWHRPTHVFFHVDCLFHRW